MKGELESKGIETGGKKEKALGKVTSACSSTST
jgi:hypothetical protein